MLKPRGSCPPNGRELRDEVCSRLRNAGQYQRVLHARRADAGKEVPDVRRDQAACSQVTLRVLVRQRSGDKSETRGRRIPNVRFPKVAIQAARETLESGHQAAVPDFRDGAILAGASMILLRHPERPVQPGDTRRQPSLFVIRGLWDRRIEVEDLSHQPFLTADGPSQLGLGVHPTEIDDEMRHGQNGWRLAQETACGTLGLTRLAPQPMSRRYHGAADTHSGQSTVSRDIRPWPQRTGRALGHQALGGYHRGGWRPSRTRGFVSELTPANLSVAGATDLEPVEGLSS